MSIRSTTLAITVDVHERQSQIAERLEALGLDVTVRRLAVGDYAIGSSLIERKTVLDLHRTLFERRLWRQLGGLRMAEGRPYLIVEGRCIDAGPLERNALRGALLSVMDHRIPVIRTEDEDDSALWLARIAFRHARKRSTASNEQPRKPHGSSPEDVLATVTGVGYDSARHLLDHFGTIRAIALASFEELAGVRGIGPRRAAWVHEALTRSRNRERDPST